MAVSWAWLIFADASPVAVSAHVFCETSHRNGLGAAAMAYFAEDPGAHFAAIVSAAISVRLFVFPAVRATLLIWSYSCLLTFFGVLSLIHGVAFHKSVQIFVFIFIVESLELTIFTSSVSSESNSSLNYFRVTLLLPRVRSEVITWTYLFSECPGTDTPTHREGRATHETKKSDHEQDTGHRFYFYLSGPQAVP